MGFESYRQGAFTKRLADLPDQPNMQAAELKTYFDSSPEELRQALNRLCDALGEFSAAAKLGYTASAGVPAQTVQDAIENVQKQVRDASVGKLPSGCVDGDKLVNVEIDATSQTDSIGGAAAKVLAEQMLANNSVEVDGVTAATVTSDAVKAAAAAALAELGLTNADLAKVEAAEKENYTDLTCDVLVIGTGAAGGAAAMAAAEAGAKVIAIEKLATIGGTSAMAGGGIAAPESSEQKKYGIEDTCEAYVDLWVEYNHNEYFREDSGMDEDRIRFVVGQAAGLIDWLEENGFEFGRPMSFDLIEGVDRFHYASNGKPTDLLYAKNQELGVEYWMETKATALLTDENGNCIGATVEKDGQTFNIYAKGTVLATGGFGNNQEMMERFTPVDAAQVAYFYGSAGQTGEGILMAEAIGAAVYEKGARLGMSYVVGDGTNAELTSLGGPWSQAPIVDNTGVRFVNEYCHSLNYPSLIYRHAAPYYCIYGSDREDYAAILANNVDDPAVTSADTLEELADKLGFDKQAFLDCIAVYNAAKDTGVDAAFGARVDFMNFATVGPFYAVQIAPQYTGTIGGVVTDTSAQVLRADGTVIGGLYAAGEASNGALYDLVYMSGSSFLNALSMGRIAGENAANQQ